MDIDALERFSKLLEHLEELSDRLWVPSIERDDGLILASLSSYVASLGGRVFIDAGAGVGYSTLWILYGLASVMTISNVTVYAIEWRSERYKHLVESLDKAAKELFSDSRAVEVKAIHGDAVELLKNIDRDVDFIFIDIEKHRYIDMLKLLPKKLSEIGLAVFHNALAPGLSEEVWSYLRNADNLVYHIIQTRMGLLLVRRTL
uniref:O-methyltransferase n=1 Tax=Ignisphaera aggregans TaxID=334771 RepID=A0A7J2U2U8_9CREN